MTDRDRTREEQQARLAAEALDAACGKIVANMRFMAPAVFALEKQEIEHGFRTDGQRLLFAPREVLRRCRDGLGGMTHDIMHVLLHCLFQHHRPGKRIERHLWDLAADIAVEELIASFGLDCFETSHSGARRDALAHLRQERGRLTAERIYRSLRETPPTARTYHTLHDLFVVDDHSLWYSGTRQDAEQTEGEGEEQETEGRVQEDDRDWEQIGELVRAALAAEEQETGSGELRKELEHQKRETIDYTTFLRKFAARREALKVDDSAFDYIFYTYGLSLYGDMPLIEPLEYSDEKQIRDLVIAIDTSGSTEGALVRSFVRRTMELLDDREVLRTRFQIHLLQCDAFVQEAVVLRSREETEAYLAQMELKGLGGTDFRPVFRYVDDLLALGELSDLRGLLYFTDGKGTFPGKKPAYDTAFIFTSEEEEAEVPPWAMKVVFDDEEGIVR